MEDDSDDAKSPLHLALKKRRTVDSSSCIICQIKTDSRLTNPGPQGLQRLKEVAAVCKDDVRARVNAIDEDGVR